MNRGSHNTANRPGIDHSASMRPRFMNRGSLEEMGIKSTFDDVLQ